MRRRLLLIAIVAGVGTLGAGVAVSSTTNSPQPEVACSVAPQQPCMADVDCAVSGAVCDTVSGFCVCPTDMGRPGDLGNQFGDGGGADLSTPGSGGGGGTGGGTNGAPPVVTGQTGPARNGCSYLPGSAW
ncbi:MAG TPA: hypothetical protein VGL86_24840 [Polyangia bacterium]|jgi:hypothetical protein